MRSGTNFTENLNALEFSRNIPWQLTTSTITASEHVEDKSQMPQLPRRLTDPETETGCA